MAEREIKIGFLRYRDLDGKSVLGFHGESVDVHEDDLERFDELNTVAEPEVPQPGGFSQDDVDAAVAAAEEAKDAELADAIAELDKQRQQFEADKAAFEKAQTEAAKSAETKTPAKPAGK